MGSSCRNGRGTSVVGRGVVVVVVELVVLGVVVLVVVVVVEVLRMVVLVLLTLQSNLFVSEGYCAIILR
jgi:hypothetical protein